MTLLRITKVVCVFGYVVPYNLWGGGAAIAYAVGGCAALIWNECDNEMRSRARKAGR